MNLIEAIMYLKEDEDNRAIDIEQKLIYKFESNTLKYFSDFSWVNSEICANYDGKFEIYKEEKLYTFAEMTEELSRSESDKKFISISNADIKLKFSCRMDSFAFIYKGLYGDRIPLGFTKGQWREIK